MSSVLPVYRRSDITITRGEGVYLFAPDGTRYLDFASGIAVNSLGHCHPHVVNALKAQSEQLWHCSNMYQMPGLSRFAERLVANSFADKVFFCNSGSEAVECGLKMIRKYFAMKTPSLTLPPDGERGRSSPSPAIAGEGRGGGERRYRVITMQGGFHGRTLACISAGGNDVARKGYEPLVDGFDRAEFNNISDVEQKITPQTAGILVEPIQGEGGVREASHEFLQGLRKLCDKHGLLLMVDEVQCGYGRTGTLFAHEQSGIKPDIVSSAKGIGNGFPLAACLMTDKVASCVTPGSHGSTYGSNPLAMAVGNAVLDVMLADGFFQHVENMANELKKGLMELAAKYPTIISGVRGRGLMLGIQVSSQLEMVKRLRAKKLLTAPAEDRVIRIVPPLVVQASHIQEALAIIDSVCEGWV